MPNYEQAENPLENIEFQSKFYDVEVFIETFKNTKLPIFINLNIQSLNAKYNKLNDLVNRLLQNKVPIQIIALQETWNIKYVNSVELPGFQKLIFKNRSIGRGGGVGFYIRNGLTYNVINPPLRHFEDKIFESLSLEITDCNSAGNKKYIVTNVYRSPTVANGYTAADQLDEFFIRMDLLMNYLNSLNCKSYLFLDSNINLLNVENSNEAATYISNILNNGYIPANTKATRMQNNSSSLIDNILTNEKSQSVTSGSIIEDISDHWLTFYQCSKKTSFSKKVNKNLGRRLINDTTLTNFQRNLQNLHWNDVLGTDTVDDCYDLFWDKFKTVYDICFPVIKTRFNRNYHRMSDFMTSGLLTSRRTKIHLLKTSLAFPTDSNKQKFKAYRNLYNKIIKVAKKNSIQERLQKCQKNPKKTWDILRELTGKGKGENSIGNICSDGQTYTDDGDIANQFNKFFASVGNQISDSIEHTDANYTDFLHDRPNVLPLDFGTISQAEFITIINNLEPKSSGDIDGISNKMLKFVKFELATPLVHLFNLSLRTGIFPSKLKMSRTVPIFKNGDPAGCDNYRPISLLSNISKVLEKAVAERLMNHLKYNKLINENQFGFQEGVSTVHHLTKLTNYVAKELNNKNYVIGIFLDLKKAFDVVPHKILIEKLKKLGIGGMEIAWFTNYLAGRTQKVEINGQLSDIERITISILQGSILGPILFLCFINDLPNCIDMLALLFADDTAGLLSGPELQPLIDKANSELQKLSVWFRANKMAVNVKKTKYIIFKQKGKRIDIGENGGVVFNNNDINSVQDPSKIFALDRIFDENPNKQDRSFKLLGVWLDEHLSFNQHCMNVSAKLSQANFIISRVKNLLPKKVLKTLYFALFHPHILYCLPVFGCTSGKNIKKIATLQKKAVRAICAVKHNAHTAELFQQLNILPLDKLITFSQSMLTHSIIHKYGPPALHNQWQSNAERNPDLELRNANDLYIPLAKSEQVKKLTYFALAKNWNNLPIEKQYANPTTFRIFLKEHLSNI
jgi:hypothetical protein